MAKSYSAENIQTLDAVTHIRLRPGMYIGGVGEMGLMHLTNEVIDNAVDEFNEGRGDTIDVYIDQSHSDDVISVRDYGNGIPVGISDDGKNTLTKVFTTLFTGGKFDDTYSSDVSGMNGVGVKAVNALSSSLKVTSCYNGHKYYQEFKRGEAVTDVIDKGETSKSGTKVTFIPDSKIFKEHKLPADEVILKCRYLASIKPKFRINLKIKDTKSNISEYTFYEENELESIFNEGRDDDSTPLVSFSHFTPSTRVKFEYLPRSSSSIKSFCNTIYTRDGGYHEDAIISAISNSLKKLTGKNISKSSIFQGLNLVISVYKKNPIYRGQNKTRIADEDIKKFVYDEMYQPIYDALSKEKKFLRYITEISQAQEKAIEESALKAVSSDIKSKANKNRLPSKLFFVQNCSPERRELILTEGDSSSGSVAKARITSFQEVLPLRGKCLNLIKAGMTRALGNQEVNDIFLSVGGMEGTNTKLRTHNVFILSDPDSDGAHIFSLIESMFIIAFPSFIKEHNLYVIKTALFCATDGKRRTYGQTAKQAGSRFKKEFKSENFYIQRNKGIGEMSPSDLRYFIDPKTRTVEKVILGENSREEMIKLMGDDSTYRRAIMNEIDEEIYSNSLINGTDVEESEGE